MYVRAGRMANSAQQQYVHGYHERESARLRPGRLRAGPATRRYDVSAWQPGSRGRMRHRCPDGHPRPEQPRNTDCVHRPLGRLAGAGGLDNVEFRLADLFTLPVDAPSFDHVFVCFVLEHLAKPEEALALLRRLIRPGGTITVFEGDHRLDLLSPAQRRGPPGDCLPGRTAAATRRQRVDRTTVESAAGERGVRGRARVAADGLR